MDWHYAENGQRVGPVSEEQLLQLAQSGVVKPETLVWRAGMPEWKVFREAGPGAPPPLPPPGRLCASCGRPVALGEFALFGESAVCGDCKPAWVQRLRQGMVSTSPWVRYAGFWIRVVAQLIDGIIVGAVMGPVFFMLFGGRFFEFFRQVGEAGAQGNRVDPVAVQAMVAPLMASFTLFPLLALVATVAYYVFFWVNYAATPGKMAVGIKVVRSDGGPIQTGQAFGRSFAHMLSGFTLYIGYMMAGWDEQKRALHDRLAETRVIYK